MPKTSGKMPGETQPLRKAFDQLKKDGKVSSQKDFAQKVKYHETSMVQMLSGIKPVPVTLIKEMVLKFDVNANFIVTGAPGHPIYNTYHAATQEQLKNQLTQQELLISELKARLTELQERIEEKSELLKLYRKRVPDL